MRSNYLASYYSCQIPEKRSNIYSIKRKGTIFHGTVTMFSFMFSILAFHFRQPLAQRRSVEHWHLRYLRASETTSATLRGIGW
jgi:hypothetical protein